MNTRLTLGGHGRNPAAPHVQMDTRIGAEVEKDRQHRENLAQMEARRSETRKDTATQVAQTLTADGADQTGAGKGILARLGTILRAR